MNYMSLEISTKSFECAVVNESGSLMQRSTLPVSLKAVRDVIQTVKAPLSLVFEEGELAGWLYRNLINDVDQIVVAEPWYNRLIYDTDTKTDNLDVIKLVKLFRGGFIQPVHHTHDEDRAEFKRLVFAYHDTSKQLTRCKNQVKSQYRVQGVIIKNKAVYSPDHREGYLSRLTSDKVIRSYYERLDLFSQQKERLKQETKRRSRTYPEIARFDAIPGVGPIGAATFYAVIDDPNRFTRKQQIWSYCHLGKGSYESGNLTLNRKQKRGNRWLKRIALNAATLAIRSKPNPYRSQYIELVEIKGKDSRLAKRIVARHILTTMWAMWRKGERYRG